jgi:arginase
MFPVDLDLLPSWQPIIAPFAWGAGYDGTDRGARHLADLLRQSGALSQSPAVVDYDVPRDQSDPRLWQAYPHVLAYMPRLAKVVAEHITAGHKPLVIGGDHSVALGTWSGVVDALQAYGQFGLLWVDAHMDAHTPITCGQGKWGGHFHGMPVAHLLGHGDHALCNLAAPRAKIAPQYLVLFGVRSYEPAEAALLTSLGVRVFTSHEIAQRGVEPCLAEALGIVRRAPKGWGLSFDYDALDPHDMPYVGTPEPDGLSFEAWRQAARSLGAQIQTAVAMEWVEWRI